MARLGEAVRWVEERLDKGYWFQHGYVVFATYMTCYGVNWAMRFAESSKLSGTEIGIVIAAVMAPVATVQTFAFNSYLKAE